MEFDATGETYSMCIAQWRVLVIVGGFVFGFCVYRLLTVDSTLEEEDALSSRAGLAGWCTGLRLAWLGFQICE